MAKTNWTISGTLLLKDVLIPNTSLDVDDPPVNLFSDPPNNGRERILVGVTVGVQASDKMSGGYVNWGKTRTGWDGRFSHTVRKSGKPRRFIIRVRFENDDIFVRWPYQPWVGIYVTPLNTLEDGHEIDIGRVVLGEDAATRAQSHEYANYAYLAMTAVHHLKEHGLPFTHKIKVDLMQRPLTGTSWANGVLAHTANVAFSAMNAVTVLHEMMHLWNYQHNVGTTNWLGAVTWDFDTAGHQENPNVAFHEGFAEYCAWELMHVIWGFEKGLPYTRQELVVSRQLLNNDMVERNWHGVESVLRFLTAEDPYAIDVGRALDLKPRYAELTDINSPCAKGQLFTLYDVLDVFYKHPDKGVDTLWNAGNKNGGVFAFLERAATVNDNLSESDRLRLVAAIDPQGDLQMWDLCIEIDEVDNQRGRSRLTKKEVERANRLMALKRRKPNKRKSKKPDRTVPEKPAKKVKKKGKQKQARKQKKTAQAKRK